MNLYFVVLFSVIGFVQPDLYFRGAWFETFKKTGGMCAQIRAKHPLPPLIDRKM
jgi:hypothetical protein